MEDYKKMYLHLFNETTKAIEILKKAQCECEDMFINFEESPKKHQKSKNTRNKISNFVASPVGEAVVPLMMLIIVLFLCGTTDEVVFEKLVFFLEQPHPSRRQNKWVIFY